MVHRWLIAIAGTLAIAAIAAIAGSPASAQPAVARTVSSNWAGYAVTGHRVHFRTAFGTWVQPAASCSADTPTSAAIWVGIGGYHPGSRALDQIGTEVDCTAAGGARYSAWYELIPAGSVRIPLTVRPGDRIAASVSVTGHRVRLRLHDVTTKATFTRIRRARNVDVSSAEWIVEAPALCDGNDCRITQLADFGTTGLSTARATATTGHTGAIADPAWSATAIDLVPGGPPLGNRPAVGMTLAGSATTGDLSPTGDAFGVTYQSPTTTVPGFPTGPP